MLLWRQFPLCISSLLLIFLLMEVLLLFVHCDIPSIVSSWYSSVIVLQWRQVWRYILTICEYVIYQVPASKDPPPLRRRRPHEAAAAGASTSRPQEVQPAEWPEKLLSPCCFIHGENPVCLYCYSSAVHILSFPRIVSCLSVLFITYLHLLYM